MGRTRVSNRSSKSSSPVRKSVLRMPEYHDVGKFLNAVVDNLNAHGFVGGFHKIEEDKEGNVMCSCCIDRRKLPDGTDFFINYNQPGNWDFDNKKSHMVFYVQHEKQTDEEYEERMREIRQVLREVAQRPELRMCDKTGVINCIPESVEKGTLIVDIPRRPRY